MTAGERKCAWCGEDISHRHGRAKFCRVNCKQAFSRSGWGDEEKRAKAEYSRKYYAENAETLKARQRERNSDSREHRAARDKAYYEANRESRKKKQREWLQNLKREQPAAYREHLLGQRERANRRAAAAAISMLILPIEKETEE